VTAAAAAMAATLARGYEVAVHAHAHGAAGINPFQSSIAEDAVEAFLLRLAFHRRGSWGDQAWHSRLVSRQHGRRRPQILDAAVCARADKDPVDGNVGKFLPGDKPHVVERLADVRRAGRIGNSVGVGHCAGDRRGILRADAPGNDGGDFAARQAHLPVEGGIRVARKRQPVRRRLFEKRAGRRVGTAAQVVDSGRVGSDHAAASARLDREVAQCHAAFHREPGDGVAGIFDGMAGGAVRADAGNDRQRDVLGRNAWRKLAVDRDAHPLRLFLPQGLRHENVGNLGGADPEGDGAEGAMGGGMAVAADDGEAGKRDPLLRADHMDDTLRWVVETEEP
jgi:hypothetical protein